MTTIEATSEVFLTAFRALPKKTRAAVVDKMLRDKEFLEDLMDTIIIEQRQKEPSRSLDDYLSAFWSLLTARCSANKDLIHNIGAYGVAKQDIGP
jgi:hypothetical protein